MKKLIYGFLLLKDEYGQIHLISCPCMRYSNPNNTIPKHNSNFSKIKIYAHQQ